MVPDPDFADQAVKALTRLDASYHKDARIKELISKWSRCMKDKGFDFESPVEPITKFRISGYEPRAGAA
jgi:hypothetical protein